MATLKPMTNMLFDIWVYVGIFGFIGSAVAFPFLLSRYRQAAAVDMHGSDEVLDALEEVDPVAVVEETNPGKSVETVATAEDSPKAEAPKAEHPLKKAAREGAAEVPSSLKTGQTTAGGISPAVVYLQNLKLQMEHFEQEIHSLRSQVVGFAHKHDQEFDILLKKMTEFQTELHHEMSDQPAAVKQPAPIAAKPAPVAAKPAPVAAKPAPVAAKPAPAAVKPPTKPVPVAVKPAAQPAPVVKQAPVAKPAPSAKPAAAQPEVKPAAAPVAKPAPAPEPAIELSIAPEKAPAGEPKLDIVVEPAPAAEPELEIAAEKPKEDTPQDVADSLSLSVPDADEGKDDDPLKPDTSKGPVWPV